MNDVIVNDGIEFDWKGFTEWSLFGETGAPVPAGVGPTAPDLRRGSAALPRIRTGLPAHG